ncbi:sigma 54-interacting transcriptional regulator [Enterococcus gallinarum]|uniref:sigma 54-interacting transcriptional regulator n=1 Tax=Enterococcus gallinarum TaxID=1353 RepID=UPI0012E1DB1C|nr:sigma-54-dependent transcriptional regulator [Enterococcus gallinarum]MUN91940.1 PRD domain-containing protein [Enterococcus gallinarum]
MQRIEKIEMILAEQTKKQLTTGELTGVTAKEISDLLALARNAVSEDLNKLLNIKKAIRIKSRPVLFFSKIELENEKNYFFKEQLTFKTLAEFKQVMEEQHLADSLMEEDFSEIIGYKGSLKNQIEKLKAAVLYPPYGLNILLGGESGVGKTLLAESLHKYYEKFTNRKTPFVYFNCSEYYNNPELLTSHLFGYQKGSFTGAIEDKAGLIEHADQGFLFLDEVHRLSNEGQEKLFTLLDKGYFSRIGEANTKRTVNVRFIFATTEDFSQTFLKTFLRRIPVALILPTIKERPIQEKIELVVNFFQNESHKIKKDITINYQVIEQLVFKKYQGNIGEMKSEIQFICAQGYLKQLEKQASELVIDSSLLLNEETFEKDAKDQIALKELLAGESLKIKANNRSSVSRYFTARDKINDAFYDFLLKEFSNLKNSNIPQKEVTAILQKKIDQLFDMRLFEPMNKAQPLRKIDESFEKKIAEVTTFIQELTGLTIPKNLIDVLANHIYSTLLFMDIPNDDFYLYSSQLMLGRLENYDISQRIVEKVSELFSVQLPKTEITYFGLLLRKLKQADSQYRRNDDCGVIVVAHGSTTATSMAEYANVLFSSNLLKAVNMPIHQTVEETLEKVKSIIRVNKYKRLLLLVDIGSLVYFGNLISEEFGIEVLLIKNINLLTLLEVSREVIYESTEFDYLLPVLNEKGHLSSLCKQGHFFDSKVLIISCMTGLGTALKIEKLIVDVFQEEVLENIRILTLDNSEVQDIDRIHRHIQGDEKLVGIVGTFQTEIPDVPFIPLEELFSEKGVERLLLVFGYDMSDEKNRILKEKIAKRYVHGLTLKAIINHITVLNPQRLSIEVSQVYDDLCRQLKIDSDEKTMLRFLIHTCCTVERLVINNEYNTAEYNLSYKDIPDEASVIKMAFRSLEVSYNIQFSPLEIKYIYELLYCS